MATLEERMRIVERDVESAMLAAAGKMGRAEVSKAEFQRYRIEFAMLLDERLNVNQVPVRLGDLLERIEALEESAGNSTLEGSAGDSTTADAVELLELFQPFMNSIQVRLEALEAGPVVSTARAQALPPAAARPAPATRPAPVAAGVFGGAFEPPALGHGGVRFSLRVMFSEVVGTGWRGMRDYGFRVQGGTVVGARRVNGRSDYWELTIDPAGMGAVSISTTSRIRAKSGPRATVTTTTIGS